MKIRLLARIDPSRYHGWRWTAAVVLKWWLWYLIWTAVVVWAVWKLWLS